MSWTDILIAVISGIFTLATTAISIYGSYFLSQKVKNNKIRDIMFSVQSDIVLPCVLEIQQTIVDNLKKEGRFDAEAQKQALELCMQRCLTLISDEAKDIIMDNFGDLEAYLTTLIESSVKSLKLQ